MRYFNVPFNIDEEDKVIGGYLSLRQFFWLALSGLIILLLFIVFKGYLNVTNINGKRNISVNSFRLTIRIIISVVVSIINALMAFYKDNYDMYFDKYCIKLFKFKFRKHIYKFSK